MIPKAAKRPLSGPMHQPPRPSVGFEIDGLRAFPLFIGLDLESDALAFVQGAQSSLFDGRDMDENVPSTVIRLDEPIAFVGIEKLHYTLLRHPSRPCKFHFCEV
jgi:hypothetical protein